MDVETIDLGEFTEINFGRKYYYRLGAVCRDGKWKPAYVTIRGGQISPNWVSYGVDDRYGSDVLIEGVERGRALGLWT